MVKVVIATTQLALPLVMRHNSRSIRVAVIALAMMLAWLRRRSGPNGDAPTTYGKSAEADGLQPFRVR